jgi:hypothetical protein
MAKRKPPGGRLLRKVRMDKKFWKELDRVLARIRARATPWEREF